MIDCFVYKTELFFETMYNGSVFKAYRLNGLGEKFFNMTSITTDYHRSAILTTSKCAFHDSKKLKLTNPEYFI